MRSCILVIMSRKLKMANHDLLIAKPKKSEGTFICTIKQPFYIELPGSHIIHIKETNDAAQFIFIKNKQFYNYIYDLNASIIEIVKENCSTWFNTNMNPDLVEDYYTSTLVYDKTHGELIKLKIVDADSQLLPSDLVGSKLNIKLQAKNLRFYKQKFVLETVIESYEVACDIIDFSDDEKVEDEEEAYPSQLELEEMQREVVTKYQSVIDELEIKIAPLKSKLEETLKKQAEMAEAVDIDDIIRIYNEFES